ENLYGDGTLRYTSADNMFTAIRSEWILVGGVIKKFDEDNPGEVRKVRSGDFYIADHKPHVYMQHFKLENSNIVPGIPFTSLAEEVDETKAFGIYIPDQYGDYKLPAEIYYQYMEKDESKVNDGKVNKIFTFEGRFANETDRPTYTISATGLDKCVFVNNSYPANLNVAKLLDDKSSMGLQAKVYNYKGKGWDDVDASSSEEYAVYVKPNNGFVLYAMTSAGSVKPDLDHYGTGSTNYLKAASAFTMLKLQVSNTADNTASTLSVKYEGLSLPKAFSYNASTPEIYVPDGADMYSTYGINDLTEIIPLSVRNKQSSGSLTVKFELTRVDGFESVILEDRLMGVNYELLDGPAYCSGIAPGDCSGRFYLNINYAEEETTSVVERETDADGGNCGIDIYPVGGHDVVISSSESVAIETVYVTDMAGRTKVVKPNDAHYNRLTLDSASGVYVIKAVGDSASKTEKVIIK
ncbi:MAG: T9SS type A sorting domain-containing protein, partial [Paludibacteraceae bacterium]|nr:T9SS type A sorting domain-containing protein [Paludibacteraceae bacterium]